MYATKTRVISRLSSAEVRNDCATGTIKIHGRWHAGAHWNARGGHVRCLRSLSFRQKLRWWLKHWLISADSSPRRLGRQKYVPSLSNTWTKGGPGATLTQQKVRRLSTWRNAATQAATAYLARSNARISCPADRLHRCPVTKVVKCHRRISRFWHLC